jgi:hypothetical protein
VVSDVRQIAQRLSPRFLIQIYYELLAQSPVCIILLIFKMKLLAKCNERTGPCELNRWRWTQYADFTGG